MIKIIINEVIHAILVLNINFYSFLYQSVKQGHNIKIVK